MITKHKCGKITWIDIANPTKEDIDAVRKEYKIYKAVGEELLSPTLYPKIEHNNKHYLYIILHFPTVINPRGGSTEQEINFVIGKDFIITAHYQSIEVLNQYSKILDMEHITKKCTEDSHAGFLFYRIIENIYEKIRNQLNVIKNDLKEVEGKTFNGEERKMVEEISEISKKLLDFRVATRSHSEVLESFRKIGKEFFGEDFSFYLGSIVGESYRVHSMLEEGRETLNELRNTNDSLLNTKSNDIMRTLTILAFVTFPLSLFASLFGMNTRSLPIVGHPYDFWIIVTIMITLVVIFFGIFKYKKWL